ncbi:Ig-like domain-containing protein [Conexibacter sp. SYSU D00693]|uniref:Ig-like domain-containing protein n=1 Tax=Conexibacter sp. SYSU D00693 TaxID=2812560 RepID=UPI00196B5871|nr:Ig-like domain-containing protein [Conexibacter sp. SYSU D00693]
MARRVVAAVAAIVGLGIGAQAAEAAAPVIVNNTGGTTWRESEGVNKNNRQVAVTFVVRHDPGRRVTGLAIDQDYNGNDDTGGVGVTGVTAQTLGGASNRLQSSVVRFTFSPPDPGGFSCPIAGGATRRRDLPLRFRVVDSSGERSGSVSQNVRITENGDCLARTDYSALESWGQSASTATPGQNVNFSFRCDDGDSSGDNDACDYILWRARRLNDGAITDSGNWNADDNTDRTYGASFPTRGVYVVEGRLCGETNCNDDDRYWRIGSVMVNETNAPSLDLSGPSAVNVGQPATVSATASDVGTNGDPQVIEWDADNNGAFERTVFTTPQNNGSVLYQDPISGAALQQAVDTSTPGIKTVRARVFDNGAVDAADDLRREANDSFQVRVNAAPTASDISTSTDEDTAKAIALQGADADSFPSALTYAVGQPAAGTGTVSLSGGTATYTPPANWSGTTSFTYQANDGMALSPVRTVTVTVDAVNDLPSAGDTSITTAEDTPVDVTLTATDVDGDSLAFAAGEAEHGTVACDGADCTYTPDADFSGEDAFPFTVSDGHGGTDAGVVTVTVTAQNDPPTAGDASIETDEDTPVTFTPPASDPDGPFTLSATDPAHGTVDCATTCTYTPDADFSGPDEFDYTASDGTSSDTGHVTVTVNAVNDAPSAGDTTATTAEDTPLELQLAGTDVDGDDLTFDAGDPEHGTLACDGADCTYTPAANFSGEDSFTFSVSDGHGGTDEATVSITVSPVNDAPVVQDTSITTDEDSDVTFTPPASDADDGTLTLSATDAAHGTVTCGATTCTYAPDADFAGTDEFDVTATDDDGASDTGHVTVTVDPVNDAPVANDQTVTTDEDEDVRFDLSGQDVDGDDLTFDAGAPEHGTLACDEEDCEYTPAPNFNGTDGFDFTVSDGNGGTDTGRVDLIVAAVNDAPNAQDVTATTDEDTAVELLLLGSDPDGDTLTYAAQAPSHGDVSCTAAGCTYTPDADFHGTDEFTYFAFDGNGGADSATVRLTVTPVNDAPVANDQLVTTTEDTPAPITLAAQDVDGDALTFTAQDGAHGTVSCDGAACTYLPAPNFHGADAFTFTVSDGTEGGSDTGRIDVIVAPVNDAPTAQDRAISTDEDEDVGVTLLGADVDGDQLTYVAGAAEHGTVECDGPGCTYTPEPNFNGADAFTYTVSDGEGGSGQATVTVTVDPVNDAPVAQDGELSTDEDEAADVTLQAQDLDGDELTFTPGTPAHGTVTCDGATCTYTPAADFHGADAFTFVVSDGHGGTDSGRIDVTVAPVDDTPTASDTTATTDEDTAVDVDLPVADADGDDLTATVAEEPEHGAVACEGITCRYTPAADFHGTDTFRYAVSDGEGDTAQGTVTVTVRPVNDAPVAQDGTAQTDEDTPVDVAIAANDVDGDTLAAVVDDEPGHGTVACEGLTCRYTPAADYAGPDAFRVRVQDGHGGSDLADVAVTVRPANDAPVATDRTLAAEEDATSLFEVRGTDVDGDSLTYTVSRPATKGTVTCEADGDCRYVPNANANGADSFAFRADDGHGGTDEGEVTITIAPVNDAPTAQDVSAATDEDTPVDVALLGNDIDGDALSFSIVDGPDHGQVQCAAALCRYTPAADYHGTDELTYKVTDPSGASATAKVRITITSISVATRLDVPPTIKISGLPLQIKISYSATLRRAGDGAPIAGKKVTFLTGGQPACTATTDANGYARCAWQLSQTLAVLLGGGYSAVFTGDADFEPSRGQGRLIG